MTGPREPADTGLGTTRTSGVDTSDLTPLFELDRSTLCCGGSEELKQREHRLKNMQIRQPVVLSTEKLT